MPHSLCPAVCLNEALPVETVGPRYTWRMPQAAAEIDLGGIQAALAADGLDAWLLYDFHGLNPIAAEVTGVNRRGGHLATRRWYYLIPASGEPRGLVHAIERNALDHLPGTISRYAGRDAARVRIAPGAQRDATRRHGVFAAVRDSVSGAGRCRHGRTHSPVRRRRRVVRRSRPAVRRRLGRRRGRYPQARIREAVSDQRSGVCRRLRADGRGHADDRVRHPTTHDGLVSRRRAGERFSADRGGGRQRRQPALHADEIRSPSHPAGRDRAARSVGKTRSPWRGLRRHHLGRLYGRASTRAVRAGVCHRGGGARRGGFARPASRQRRPGARGSTRLAGRSRGIQRASQRRLRRSRAASHRPQPRRVGARQRRQHGRLRNARRSAPACRARALRSSPASTSTTLASDRKSTCSSANTTQW